jgi:solute carrier family 66 (lysosomal lysine-arginine transporter), member 1
MFPPSQGLQLDISAISGICGSISIACWVVVFSPQIIENFRRSSADGLSVVFIVVWLAGDIFNILGAVLQGVLPTMIILAVYYTLADLVLLFQLFYYKGFTLRDEIHKPGHQEDRQEVHGERSPLLNPNGNGHPLNGPARISDLERRHSSSSFRELMLGTVDSSHLSPANPAISQEQINPSSNASQGSRAWASFKSVLFNTVAVLVVCAAGVLGWWLSNRHSQFDDEPESADLHFNMLGQVFGYICAVLYLASRVPQLLLNYRRKSTEGISMLFFLFACIGNLTYVLSIFAYEPVCKNPRRCRHGESLSIYGKYIAVNASWLAGSLGTLFLDAGVFVQYFLYRTEEQDSET